MLDAPTPYPFVGSYALFIDPDLPESRQSAELVRIQWRRAWTTVGEDGSIVNHGEIVISFPLRDGAAGNKRVDPAQLIDTTALTPAEAREFHDLDRDLAGIDARIRRWIEEQDDRRTVGGDGGGTTAPRKPRMTAKQKAMAARRAALKKRIVYGPIIDRLLRQAHAQAERRPGQVGWDGPATRNAA